MDSMSREKMGRVSNLDTINHLPDNVIDQILIKLPLRDAVRTSVLSSNWRYKWTNISQLALDDKYVTSIDHVLLLHNSPVHKFKLSVFRRPIGSSSIDRWLFFLLRKNVKQVILRFPYNERYDPPPSLFSSQNICSLELTNCVLKLPMAFIGFSSLTNLKLRWVSCANEVLECLISMSPLLEELWLESFSLGHLKLCAPKLKSLEILDCQFKDIGFENVPLLSFVVVVVTVNTTCRGRGGTCTLVKHLDSLPNIKRFILDMQFIQPVAAYDIPLNPPAICQHLHILNLVMDLQDKNETMTSLCIINSSPNLRELTITVATSTKSSGTNDMWKAQSYPTCNIYQLKVVNIFYMKGDPAELEFIKFLATNSPKLEMLRIRSRRIEVSEFELLKTLFSLQRAYPKAEINFRMIG